MNVAVLGLGYIGLPTAAMLANAGHRVTGVDVNDAVLQSIRSGDAHAGDPEVASIAQEALDGGNLTLRSTLPSRSDAYIICVPTPTTAHKPDLRYVEQAAASVASCATDWNLIVIESTVPPRTVENVLVSALETVGKSPDRFHIAHCPERVIPGAIVKELRHNARIIGGRRRVDAERARELYASFCLGDIALTDCLTAELVKVVENTFRDINLAFANELALLSEALGVDVWEVIELANQHPRVNVLRPGPGVGGHCIPVDPTFLANANPFLTELIQTARRVNERMPHVVVRILEELLLPAHAEVNVALLGASYKADIDDTRESPTLPVLELLKERRLKASVYDPMARGFAYPLTPTLEQAVTDADAVVLLTDHAVFKDIQPSILAPLMKRRIVLDTRNFLNHQTWLDAGFVVRRLGSRQDIDLVQNARSA